VDRLSRLGGKAQGRPKRTGGAAPALATNHPQDKGIQARVSERCNAIRAIREARLKAEKERVQEAFERLEASAKEGLESMRYDSAIVKLEDFRKQYPHTRDAEIDEWIKRPARGHGDEVQGDRKNAEEALRRRILPQATSAYADFLAKAEAADFRGKAQAGLKGAASATLGFDKRRPTASGLRYGSSTSPRPSRPPRREPPPGGDTIVRKSRHRLEAIEAIAPSTPNREGH